MASSARAPRSPKGTPSRSNSACEGADPETEDQPTAADLVEGAVALGDLERVVVAEDQHVGGQSDPGGDRGEVAEGGQGIPVAAAPCRGHVGRYDHVLAAGQVVVPEGRSAVSATWPRLLDPCRRPPSRAWLPGRMVRTGVVIPIRRAGSAAGCGVRPRCLPRGSQQLLRAKGPGPGWSARTGRRWKWPPGRRRRSVEQLGHSLGGAADDRPLTRTTIGRCISSGCTQKINHTIRRRQRGFVDGQVGKSGVARPDQLGGGGAEPVHEGLEHGAIGSGSRYSTTVWGAPVLDQGQRLAGFGTPRVVEDGDLVRHGPEASVAAAAACRHHLWLRHRRAAPEGGAAGLG